MVASALEMYEKNEDKKSLDGSVKWSLTNR